MFKNILVATDGSTQARHAVRVASDLAARYGANLAAMYVIDARPVPPELEHLLEAEHMVDASTRPPVPGVSASVPVVDTTAQERSDHLHAALAEQVLHQAVSMAHEAGLHDIHTEVAEGDPAHAIVERARSGAVDLVVMGTRGLSDLRGILMGSVSHKVCQLAGCPCLTVK